METKTRTNSIVAVIGLLALSVASAGELEVPHTLKPFLKKGPLAKVNENFDAVEEAVNGNAADIAALQDASTTSGVKVLVNGEVVGRYLDVNGNFTNVISVDGINEVRVAEFNTMGTAAVMAIMAATGYRFSILTGDFEHPILREGNLKDLFLFYEMHGCAGQPYFPVEGNTGYFTNFEFGNGRGRPAKRWTARQGFVFGAPDPMDLNKAYMVRRNSVVVELPIQSFSIYDQNAGQVFCVPMSFLPDFNPANPLDVVHPVVPVEPNDPAETGVRSDIGGPITLGN